MTGHRFKMLRPADGQRGNVVKYPVKGPTNQPRLRHGDVRCKTQSDVQHNRQMEVLSHAELDGRTERFLCVEFALDDIDAVNFVK